ncbi:hypothetical protein MSG28_001081 [Choristoneura fumiferana]|uniref:Uncharacterized protein n=1 Tax=Choristoneura fumiferana TaxID=7141 RepID=A0ACC0K433_CHOFU|nr:hypothetical protein MSG28_001081 [Choristoneura fumiferana]
MNLYERHSGRSNTAARSRCSDRKPQHQWYGVANRTAFTRPVYLLNGLSGSSHFSALYEGETWTLTERDIERLSAFEIWCWGRMEAISWMERKTNEEVLNFIGERRLLPRFTPTFTPGYVAPDVGIDNPTRFAVSTALCGYRAGIQDPGG